MPHQGETGFGTQANKEALDEAGASGDQRGPGAQAPPVRSSQGETGGADKAKMSGPTAERRVAMVALACKIYQARLERRQFFEYPIFNDAGWDTLLAVYVFDAAGRTLSASQLCCAVDASATSSLRMQRRLVDVGLLQRLNDPLDGRRVLIELTTEGRQRLENYLSHTLDEHLAPKPPPVQDEVDALERLRRETADAIEVLLVRRRATHVPSADAA